MLSIDIGKKNCGYCVLTGKDLMFDVIEITGSTDEELVDSMTSFLSDVVKEYSIKELIIERQVKANTWAVKYETIFNTLAVLYGIHVIKFPALHKFKKLQIEFDTEKKAHKKLSVQMCKNYLANRYPGLLKVFYMYKKQDDLADCIIQLMVVKYEQANKLELLSELCQRIIVE
jgi:aspartyl/asparaginyl-tRNA synthetase